MVEVRGRSGSGAERVVVDGDSPLWFELGFEFGAGGV